MAKKDDLDPAQNASDDMANRASPDGMTINVDGAKQLLHELVADVSHAVAHNAPTGPSWIDRIKQAIAHLGG